MERKHTSKAGGQMTRESCCLQALLGSFPKASGRPLVGLGRLWPALTELFHFCILKVRIGLGKQQKICHSAGTFAQPGDHCISVTIGSTELVSYRNGMSKLAHLPLSRYFDSEQKFPPLPQIWASHNKRLWLVPNCSMWENGNWDETN